MLDPPSRPLYYGPGVSDNGPHGDISSNPGELIETPSVWAASVGIAMSGLLEAIPFPAAGERARTRTRVDHKTSEESDLVRRIQAGDEMAFREIDDRNQSKVFSKIYFSIRNFDFRSSLLTWIYKITVNECYDYLRKKRVRKLVSEGDFSDADAQRMEASDPAVDPRSPMDTQLAQRDLVTKLLSKVSAEDRSLIMLKEVEGHSVEELAQMTGLNENTIKVKLFRTRQKLLKAAQRLNRIRS